MIATPKIIHVTAQTAAVIHLAIPRTEMMSVFGPAVGELMTALAEQRITPSSSIFAHHLSLSRDNFDFELGVTVAAPVQPTGRVKPGELPAARVAHTIYSGPYEGLPAAWGEFEAWMKDNALEPAATLWEIYTVGPGSTPDPASWRTELNRPLKS